MPRKTVKVTINRKRLNEEIHTGRNARRVTLPKVREAVSKRIEKAQKELVKSFDSHPVTKEIEAGPLATSGILPKGNLFAFIGFPLGEKPIAVVREIIEQDIKFVVKRKSIFGLRARYQIQIPDLKAQAFNPQVTPIPWNEGRSWLDGIEKGISGLGATIFKPVKAPKNRSKAAYQSKNNVRGGGFPNQQYFSKMINEFIKNIGK